MDWIKSRSIRSKRDLAKQLDEISGRQRMHEIQREREIQAVNSDLQRCQQKTIRDLDDILQESPSRLLHRRFSLPPLAQTCTDTHSKSKPVGIPSALASLSDVNSTRSPRSRRRLQLAASVSRTESPDQSRAPSSLLASSAPSLPTSPLSFRSGRRFSEDSGLLPAPALGRRLSVDSGIATTPRSGRRLSIGSDLFPGGAAKNLVASGGFKLHRSFTSVYGKVYDGALFQELTPTLREISTIQSLDFVATNGLGQQVESLTSSSEGQTITKQQRNKAPTKLISPSIDALLENKKVSYLKPITTTSKQSKDSYVETGDSTSSAKETRTNFREKESRHLENIEADCSSHYISKESTESRALTSSPPTSVTASEAIVTAPSSQIVPMLEVNHIAENFKKSTTLTPVISSPSSVASSTFSNSTGSRTEKKSSTSEGQVSVSNSLSSKTRQIDRKMPVNRHEHPHGKPRALDAADHHNKTVCLIHEESGGLLRVLDDGSVRPEEEVIQDEESEHSMFGGSKRSGRRQTEPALGGHILKQMQARAFHAGEDVTMSEFIQAKLPSDMVAEEDENEAEKEEEVIEEEKKQDPGISNEKTETNLLDKEDGTRGQTPGTRAHSEAKETQDNKTAHNTASSKTVTLTKPPKEKGTAKDKWKGAYDLVNRRKSDGDVLKFAKVFSVKNQRPASSKTKNKKTSKDTDGIIQFDPKDAVWDAVRKCRYIRGHEPTGTEEVAEMDINEFVFGHRDPMS